MKTSTNFWQQFLTVTLIGLLIMVRFVKLGEIPYSLYWDELAIGIDGYSIAQTGQDIHGNNWLQAIYPSYGDYKAPVAIWLVGLSVKFFGLSQFAVRLPFALLWLMGLFGMWLLWKELSRLVFSQIKSWRFYDAAVAILLLCMPWSYHFSRIGFESGMSFAIAIWVFLTIWYGLKTRGLWLILSGVLAGFSIYTYFSARYIVPLMVGVLLLTFWRNASKKWWWVVGSIVIFALLTKPLLNDDLYQASQDLRLSTANILTDPNLVIQSAQMRLDSGNTLVSKLIYHRWVFTARAFLDNYLRHFTPEFLFLSGDRNLRHHTAWGGEFLFLTLPLMLVGLGTLWRRKFLQVGVVLIGWLLIAPLTAALPYEVPHASRGIYLLLPVALLICLGFVAATEWTNKYSKYFGILILVVVLGGFGMFLEDYFVHYPDRSARAWQIGNKFIGEAVKNIDDESTDIYVSEAFRLPSLAVLFARPELILEVQARAKGKDQRANYDFLRQIDNLYFTEVVRGRITQYFQITINRELKENPKAEVLESYVIPESNDKLYVYKIMR